MPMLKLLQSAAATMPMEALLNLLCIPACKLSCREKAVPRERRVEKSFDCVFLPSILMHPQASRMHVLLSN